MENGEILFIAATVLVIVFLLIIKAAEFFIQFNSDTRYIISEVRRAYNDEEYIYWRRELRCHYLCLIPFVNEKNVSRLYRRIYRKPKHAAAKERSDGLYHILAPSVIGIFICAICLCGASWAWFTATQTSGVSNIRAATYTVSVKDETVEYVPNDDGIYNLTLEENKEYNITITANGTASSGYCTVELDDKVYHTAPIQKDTALTFTVEAHEIGDLTITPQWGSCTATENIIEDRGTILHPCTSSVNGNNEPAEP